MGRDGASPSADHNLSTRAPLGLPAWW